ncbi:MAG TPA: hypothetical protein PLO13_02675 [Anaerolineaceae bacterium]|nr:hypothetical protein [Anaerolineaceae bacterium]
MQIGLAFAALLLPGLAWWLWFGDRRKDGAQALAEIITISASFIALGTLGFYTVRLKVTPLSLGIVLGLCFGIAIAGLIRRGKGAFNKTWLFALLGLSVALVWRFWQARDLVFPNWVDSQHHVLIIRKMIEFGGLPSTLEPYLPGPFYYHFGFHAVGALFSVLSGLDPATSVLMLGQAISACVGLAVYALAKQLGKDWRIGLLAAVFVTFVTKMPGYYLSWGRYTLLMGAMIMPVAMAEAIRAWDNHDHWWQLAGLSLLTAGTLLSHYFTAFLFVLFLALLGIQWLVETIRSKSANWKPIASVAIATFTGLILASRWYYRIFVYSSAASRPVFQVMEAETLKASWDYLLYLVGPTSGYILIGLGLIGLLWSVFKTEKVHFQLWAILVMFFALPTGFRLMNFRNDYFALVAFIPIAITSAFGIVLLFGRFIKRKNLASFLIMLIGAALSVGGAWQNARAVNPETILATRSDLEALEWIKTHTPEDARFFVNTTNWGFDVYRGVDGGGWILPITGRWSLAPTIFYPMVADRDFVRSVTELGMRASTITDCGDDFWLLVNDASLDYLYIKEGVGGLQPDDLISCDGVDQLINIEDVHIYLITKPGNTP